MPARTSRPRRAPKALAVTVVLAAVLALVPASAGAAPPAAVGAPPSCPAEAGAARYVRFVYLTILDRCPDPSGLAYWTRRLEAGASRWGVADAIDLSDENLRRNNVITAHTFLLGRAPTDAELQRWVGHIRRNRENGVMNASLMASDEGFARETGALPTSERDEAWVTWAYERILDRAPDPKGLAFYLGYFAPSGSTEAQRYKVAMGLQRSRSNALSWVRATMAEALDRTPDPAGVGYWLRWLTGPGRWQTFKLWTLQIASDEAYRRAQTQPEP